MNTNAAAEARRGDAANILSFLVVVSLCLSLAAYAGLRLAHYDPRGIGPRVAAKVVLPASARGLDGNAAHPAPHYLDPTLRADRLLSHGDRSRRMVALTFDAGVTDAMAARLGAAHPPRYVNDALIAELRSLQVPATLFLSGRWVEAYPADARGIAADPLFEVGSYGYSSHAFTTGCLALPALDATRAADDLERNRTILDGVAARPTAYFRFPGGCHDEAGLATVSALRLQAVGYDVVSGDAGSNDPAGVTAATLATAQAGSIVVLELTGADVAPATDRALPGIVRALRARGYELVRLSDLLSGAGAG